MGRISISILVLVFCIVQLDACAKKNKPKPPPRCSYRTCSATYDSNYSPAPGEHKCVQQRRKVHHNYQTHSRAGTGCRNVACAQRDIVRDWCKCNIYTTAELEWSAWFEEPHGEGNKVCRKRVMNTEIKRSVREFSGKACPPAEVPEPKIERKCD